jgi:hypothetical protein
MRFAPRSRHHIGTAAWKATLPIGGSLRFATSFWRKKPVNPLTRFPTSDSTDKASSRSLSTRIRWPPGPAYRPATPQRRRVDVSRGIATHPPGLSLVIDEAHPDRHVEFRVGQANHLFLGPVADLDPFHFHGDGIQIVGLDFVQGARFDFCKPPHRSERSAMPNREPSQSSPGPLPVRPEPDETRRGPAIRPSVRAR